MRLTTIAQEVRPLRGSTMAGTIWFRMAVAAAAGSSLLASAALAQDYPPAGYQQDQGYPQQGYQGQPGQQGYQGHQGYDGPPPGYDSQPPSGYDGSQPPPPPPGYQADPAYASNSNDDRRYEASAEDWAARYCVRSGNNAGGGAVIGGLLGALVGSSVAGRGDHGAGAVLGGVAGAAGGAVVGSNSGRATSPGCPPGYVVRGGAPAFAYGGGPYLYAAPGWYRPWVYYGNRWSYRPYPYHVYYYRRFGYARPLYGRPYGYRRPYGWRHRW